MKKTILMAVAVAISAAGFAQFSVGIQGTGNLSDAKFTMEDGIDLTKKMRAMPGGGLVAQYQVNDRLAFRSGINYLKHGIKLSGTIEQTGDDPAVTTKLQSDLNYVQVPVNVLYTVPVSKITFYAGGGVFFNYGLSGKIKIDNTATLQDGTVETFKEERDAFKKESENGGGLKRSDFGVGALAGIQCNKLFINLGYQLGLSDKTESSGNGKYKQHGLQLTLGYFIK